MNTGGANGKQTSIRFAPTTKSKDNYANPHPSQDTAGTTNENNNNDRSTKRGRFELEREDDNTGTRLQVPSNNLTTSESETSLFNSDRDSVSTIVNTRSEPENTLPRESNTEADDEEDHKPRLI